MLSPGELDQFEDQAGEETTKIDLKVGFDQGEDQKDAFDADIDEAIDLFDNLEEDERTNTENLD